MDMKKEDMEQVGKVLDTERVGYAFLYPCDGGARKEYMISTTPENLANFLGSHFMDAEKMIVTDMCDRLILDTFGGFINNCPNQKLCGEIVAKLAPIQMGETEAGEVIMVDRDVADVDRSSTPICPGADAFFAAEDEAVTMAECAMM